MLLGQKVGAIDCLGGQRRTHGNFFSFFLARGCFVVQSLRCVVNGISVFWALASSTYLFIYLLQAMRESRTNPFVSTDILGETFRFEVLCPEIVTAVGYDRSNCSCYNVISLSPCMFTCIHGSKSIR